MGKSFMFSIVYELTTLACIPTVFARTMLSLLLFLMPTIYRRMMRCWPWSPVFWKESSLVTTFQDKNVPLLTFVKQIGVVLTVQTGSIVTVPMGVAGMGPVQGVITHWIKSDFLLGFAPITHCYHGDGM
eukprot:Lithocolla_globosa_v1_NODE_4341_length_1458_cov_14.300071.p3 type:complete len:129 gc:universal NODE_4341_length_1458_cov_14.300071:219-605(+)